MEKFKIDGWRALADLGGSVRERARQLLRPSPRGTPHRGPPTEVSVYAPIEGQPRSFPCAKRQLSVISMLRRQSLRPASTIHRWAPVICSKRNCLGRRLLAQGSQHAANRLCATLPTASPGPELPVYRGKSASDVVHLPLPGGKLCATELTLSGIFWLRRCSDTFGRPAPRSRRVARLRSSVYRRLPDEK
jgi:hypothetical protein